MSVIKPRFEVVTPTTEAAQRRLVSVATFRALTGIAEGEDSTLELLIDGVSGAAASYCNLARAGATPPTFGQETVKATWPASNCRRGSELLLPWRVPVTAIAITDGGVELEEDVDFQLSGGGILERLSSGMPGCWSGDVIVAEYTAGWVLDDSDPEFPVPADVAACVVDQVKMQYLNRKQNPSLRSENVPDVWSGTYAVIGGDSIGESGLLKSLESALDPYRAIMG